MPVRKGVGQTKFRIPKETNKGEVDKVIDEKQLKERLDRLTHDIVQLKSVLIYKERTRKTRKNGLWKDLMNASQEVSERWTGFSALEEIKDQREH